MSNSLIYNSLHQHSEYSFLDSCNQIEPLVKRSKELGMYALALTDHGNLHGLYKFYKECNKVGIKPILGSEIYFTHKHEEKERKSRHLTILCRNNQGLSNLYKLMTIANTPLELGGGFFYRPRLDWDDLAQYHEGLICLTGCMNSPMNHEFGRNNDYEAGKEVCKEFIKIFGKEYTFVELQLVNDAFDLTNRKIYIPEQDIIYQWGRRVADDLGLKTCCSNDSHYTNPDDSFAHEILKCIDAKATLDTPIVDHNKGQTRGRLVFNGFDYYVRSTKEMLQKFTPNDIKTTQEIAEMCDVSIDETKKMPMFDPQMDHNKAYNKLLQECRRGWVSREFNNLPKEKQEIYVARIKKELSDIKEANLSNYFLIVWDILRHCRENLIPVGPGRGSAAGSIVSYLLYITQVDPVKHHLIWERFWNAGRKGSMPDIDVDVSIRHKDSIVQYIKEKFGEDKVFPMMTVGKMEAKVAIKDVGRSLGLSHGYLNDLTKHIPVLHGKNKSIKDSIEEIDVIKKASIGEDDDIENWRKEIEKAKKIKDNKKVYELNQLIAERQKKLIKLFEIAQKLEGCARNRSTHACALLISDRPIDGVIPLVWDTKKKQMITGYDMYDLEKLGFLKLDILGLKTLDVIADAHPEGAKCLYEPEKYFGPWEDEEVYDLFAKGHTKGLFQLESPLGRKWCRSLKPQTQTELSDLVAIIRPAVLDTGLAEEYLKNKSEPDDIEWLHDDLIPIMNQTNGIMLYQEQMLLLAQKFAGFNLQDSDKLRRATGKKLPEEMAKYEEQFITGCVNNGYDQKLAEKLWEWINASASYSFNSAHSCAYGGFLGYITAYIKTHYPEKFILSLLKFSKNEQDSMQEIKELFFDAKLLGIKVNPPSFLKGNEDFYLYNNEIYFGLSHIKKIGQASLQKIENIETNWIDILLDKNHILKRDVKMALILSGALDYTGFTRRSMKCQFEFIESLTEKEKPIIQKFIFGGKIEKTTKKSGTISLEIEKNDSFEQVVKSFHNFLLEKNPELKIINSNRVDTLLSSIQEFYNKNIDKEFSKRELAGYETFYLGTPLTCSEVDIYAGDFRKTHNLVEIEREINNVGCSSIVLVEEVKKRKDKNKNEMAFISVRDSTYMMSVACFSRTWETYKDIIEEGKILLIQGLRNKFGFSVSSAEVLDE